MQAPNVEAAVDNYLHGLNGLLASRARGSALAVRGQLVRDVHRPRCDCALAPHAATVKVVFASGVAIALLFNLPFVFITKAEQMHLVALGAVLMLAGACAVDVSAVRFPPVRYAIALTCIAGIASMAAVARDIARDFVPYGPVVLAHDEMVQGWAAVPFDLRDYLARKRASDASVRLSPDPSVALDLVRFGTHGPERSPDGIAYQWMSGARTEILIAASCPLDHDSAASRHRGLSRTGARPSHLGRPSR